MTGVRRPGYNRGAGQILTTPLYQPACSEAELGAQLDERLRPAHEQIGRPAALRQQRDVHRLAELRVQLQAGEVLEAQVAIEVDLGALEPGLQLGGATSIGAHQIGGAAEGRLVERDFHFGVLRFLEAGLDRVDIELHRAGLAEHHDIVAVAVLVVTPDRALGEGLEEGGDLAADDRLVALVEGHPLRDEAARLEALLHELEVLLGVERGRALHPGMDRVGRDDVELLLGGEDIVARVVVDDLHARIVHHVVVLVLEVRRDLLRHERLDLADDDALHRRVLRERPGRHARAAAHDEHGLRVRMKQRRHMAEHALQAHVGDQRGGLSLARDVKAADAVAPLRDLDGGVEALADVEAGGRVIGVGKLTPVGDELPGQDGDAADEDHDGQGPDGHQAGQPGLAGGSGRAALEEDNQRAHERERHQNLLGVLRTDPRDRDEARAERAGDGPDGVCRVGEADDAAGIVPGADHGREGQREARAPEAGRGENRPGAAHEVELQQVSRLLREANEDE